MRQNHPSRPLSSNGAFLSAGVLPSACLIFLFAVTIMAGGFGAAYMPSQLTPLHAAEVAADDTGADELRFPDEPPPEPQSYRLKDYRTIVPLTLKGAEVVGNERAMALYKSGVVFIDVMPFVPKPPNLPKGTIWRDKPRDNIPGSHWLANVGYGRLPAEMAAFFKKHLGRVSKGDFEAPLLFYCQQECWMSWNAAKRALEMGYKKIYWYPLGTDGWVTIGGKLTRAKPVPLPDLTRPLPPSN